MSRSPILLALHVLFSVGASFFLSPRLACAQLDIVVPAYFYPSAGSPWADMTAVAGEVPITAIMNPSNGPGAFKDNNYAAAVSSLRAAGGRVIGYVYTGYGARPLATVTADIDRYASWYAIDGIFVDEMANTGPAERLNYYRAIYDHAKSNNPDWEVMGNPGTATIEQYLTWPTADRLMVFENVSAEYSAYAPSAWNEQYDRSHFVHLVHTEPSAAAMQTRLQQAVVNGAGGVYVTDDVLNNPWNTLPSYWTAEVAAVAEINAAFLAGDFNADGAVDAADLADWRNAFAQSALADGDSDGDSDGHDFLIWQQQLGLATGAVAASCVAEPGPEGLLGAAALPLAAAMRLYWASQTNFNAPAK